MQLGLMNVGVSMTGIAGHSPLRFKPGEVLAGLVARLASIKPVNVDPAGKIYNAVDGPNPAPPKKPWQDHSPVNASQKWFQPWFPAPAALPPFCLGEIKQEYFFK